MPVPRAQLRVFAPLESFPPQERQRWAAYVDRGAGLTRRQVAELEDGLAVRLLVGGSRLGPDTALVRRAGSRVLICPLRLDVRAAYAVQAFRRRVPDVAFDAFVPDERWLARLEAVATTDVVPHVLDEPWAVPLPWFVAFGPDERRFRNPPEGAGPRITYLTTVQQAQARLERIVEVTETSLEDGDTIAATLIGVLAWLEWFDGLSVLELDYGKVARQFSAAELEVDFTCEELWQAVDALEEGDALGAAAAYAVARSRWAHLRDRQHAS
jgi:hypothetical protein